jgi:uncharacterized membrane protein HdeD (DUF308 family)
MGIGKMHAWKQTRKGLVLTGIVELLIAYLLGSRAIDTGSWWQYLLTVLFLLGALQNLVRTVRLHDKE